MGNPVRIARCASSVSARRSIRPNCGNWSILGRHVHFRTCERVFEQEELTTSFYNLLEGVMRLYKLLPDGRRQIVGFGLPGDFLGMGTSARHSFSADAIGPVVVCRFARTSFARFIEDKPHLLRRINEFAVRELSQAGITWFCLDAVRRRKKSRVF